MSIPITCEVVADDEANLSCNFDVTWEVLTEHDGYTTTHHLCDDHLDTELPILIGDRSVTRIELIRWTAELYAIRVDDELCAND